MARIKGTAMKSTVAFLQDRLGKDGYAKLLQSLPPEYASLLSASILQSEWYEFSMMIKLVEEAARVIPATPGRTLAWDLGRHSAEYGLSTVYKVFFKMTDLNFILKRASTLFPSYYDSGALTIVENTPHAASARVVGFNQPCELFCGRLQGWIERTVELTGSKRVSVTHPTCALRGGPHCEFRAAWS